MQVLNFLLFGLAGILVLLMGFRVFLLDQSNRQYVWFFIWTTLLSGFYLSWYELKKETLGVDLIAFNNFFGLFDLLLPVFVFCLVLLAGFNKYKISKSKCRLRNAFLLIIPIAFFILETATSVSFRELAIDESGRVVLKNQSNFYFRLKAFYLVLVGLIGLLLFLVLHSKRR